MLAFAVSLVPAAGAAEWRVDGTSLAANLGRWPVHAALAETCAAGDRTVGVAIVVYSRKQGTMAWGHASLRTVRCVGGAVVDREYETYRMSAWNERLFREAHAGEAFLDGDYLKSQRGALVLFRNADPVDGGWFADAERHNREIYELWLPLPTETLDAIGRAADAWYDAQLVTLRARAPLPERYRALSTNCTTVLARLVGPPDGRDRGPVLPFAWLRATEADTLRVLHPSHALVQRWSGLPEHVDARPRPIWRRRGALPPGATADLADGLVDRAAVGPWATPAAETPVAHGSAP